MDATDEEMCKKVRDLVYSDRRIQVEEIAQALGISHGSVSILHDLLGMRKLTARWVSKSLIDEQIATRVSVCNALLKHFRSKDDLQFWAAGTKNTVGLSALHKRAITSVTKRWISTGSKLDWLLIDLPSCYETPNTRCI